MYEHTYLFNYLLLYLLHMYEHYLFTSLSLLIFNFKNYY